MKEIVLKQKLFVAGVSHELTREILRVREEQAKLDPSQFSDWDKAKKRIQDRTAQASKTR